MWGIYWLTEYRLVSQKGLCSMELVSWLVGYVDIEVGKLTVSLILGLFKDAMSSVKVI